MTPATKQSIIKVVVWTRVQNSASGIQQYLTGKSSGQSANMRLLGHNEVNYLGEGESLPELLFISKSTLLPLKKYILFFLKHILNVLSMDKLDNEKIVGGYKFLKNLTPLNRPNLKRKQCS